MTKQEKILDKIDEFSNKALLSKMRYDLKNHFEKKGTPEEVIKSRLSSDNEVAGLWGYLKKSGEL